MFKRGEKLMKQFCAANHLPVPEITVVPRNEWKFEACAYYRPTYIAICIEKCAAVGRAGRSWSWPGYVVDRTPFGVIQHELGHHADVCSSLDQTGNPLRLRYSGDFSEAQRAASGEPALTGYAPNTAEWFAEIFRLFVTNPDLLSKVRPKTYELLTRRFTPVVDLCPGGKCCMVPRCAP